MCTVTFIPKGTNEFILTSNRDEAPARKTVAPDFYIESGVKLLYPKDEKAGGTWIGASENKRLVCLLNGGFTAYNDLENYQLSRGIVVKDILQTAHVLSAIEAYNLTNVAPFTMIIVDWKTALQLYQLVWDGTEKYLEKLPILPRIWSSSSLYSEPMKAARMQWFEKFKKRSEFNACAIWDFHKKGGHEYTDFGFVMNRGVVRTTSITQVEITNLALRMEYINLQEVNTVTKVMFFNS